MWKELVFTSELFQPMENKLSSSGHVWKCVLVMEVNRTGPDLTRWHHHIVWIVKQSVKTRVFRWSWVFVTDGRSLFVPVTLTCSSRSDFLFVVNVWLWNLDLFTHESRRRRREMFHTDVGLLFLLCWHVKHRAEFIDTEMSTRGDDAPSGRTNTFTSCRLFNTWIYKDG